MNSKKIKKTLKITRIIFIIFCIVSIIKVAHAESYNPRYVLNGTNAQAGSANLYIYTEGRLYPNRLPNYGIPDMGNTRINYCVTPSYYSSGGNEQLNSYWLEISVCTTGVAGRNGYWLSGGADYASITGVINYTDKSCYTGEYNGYVQKVYVHLLDWVTPSGGADFSWSCFQLAQDNYYSGYYNVSKVLDFQLTNDNNYDKDRDQQTIINQNQQTINNQNTQINNQQTIINNQNETNNILNDSSIPSDSDSKINGIIQSTQSQNANISDLVNFIPNTLRVIINGFNNNCTGGYSLGSLYGTELVIPCINPVDYLGSFLWGVIDSILCLCYLIPLSKFLINKYNDLTSMNNLRWQ